MRPPGVCRRITAARTWKRLADTGMTRSRSVLEGAPGVAQRLDDGPLPERRLLCANQVDDLAGRLDPDANTRRAVEARQALTPFGPQAPPMARSWSTTPAPRRRSSSSPANDHRRRPAALDLPTLLRLGRAVSLAIHELTCPPCDTRTRVAVACICDPCDLVLELLGLFTSWDAAISAH